MSGSLGLSAYAMVARLGAPLIRTHLNRRAARGKEDLTRLNERLGAPTRPRPDGPLIWMHGASVGETAAMAPVLTRLRARCPDVNALITSGTVSSAQLLAHRLQPPALHQYVPVDIPVAASQFLEHWRPDLNVWFESELWPNLIFAAAQRAPTVLLNARMSERSAQSWSRAPRAAQTLLAAFAAIAAQDEAAAARFAALGAPPERLTVCGNLKAACPPLDCDPTRLRAALALTRGRPRWTAASLHPGEAETVFRAHAALKSTLGAPLLAVAPRHPWTAPQMRATAEALGLTVHTQSAGEDLNADVFLADSMGEMGLWLRVGQAAFVGGSLIPRGGHNPLEAAKLFRPVLHGPYTSAAAADYARLTAAGGARPIDDPASLEAALRDILAPGGAETPVARTMGIAAAEAADAGGEATLDAVWGILTQTGLLQMETRYAGA